VNWALIIPIVVAVIAPAVSYILAARRMSGKIATSSAADLWEESQSIRNDYREQLASAFGRVRDLETRMAKLEGQNNDLRHENFTLTAKVAGLEALIAKLQETITEQQSTIVELKDTILKLEGR
jgi:peptidoglycan hydrolase CwlO-like protein